MSDNNWVNRDLVEAIKKGDVRAIADAGHMSYDDSEYIISYWANYVDYHGKNPVENEDEKYEKLVRTASTREFNRAIGNNHIGRMAYAVGHNRDNSTVQMANWNKYEKLKDLFRMDPEYTDLTNQIFQCMIISNQIPPTGRGKSSTMYLFSEIATSVHPELKIKSNNPNDEYDTISESWGELKKWIKSDGQKLLLLDEAKQFLMYSDRSAGKKLSQMLALLRHNECHIIMVGHTGAGIPKDLRRQLFVINKTSKKSAEIGYGITEMSNDDRYEVSSVLINLDSVPHTNIQYKSQGEQAIVIDFDDDDDDSDSEVKESAIKADDDIPDELTTKKERIKYMYSVLGWSQAQISEHCDMDQSTVSYHINN